MESDQGIHSARCSQGGWSRAAMERSAQSARWHLVDIAHGSAVEGFAGTLWGVPDSPSALSTLEKARSDGSGAEGIGEGSSRTGRLGFERVFHRWQLCSGQKRGFKVGKTKRGKGVKIMAIGDAHGLPLAVHTEAASPAEVTLVAPTLENRFVEEKPLRLIADKAYDSDPLREDLLEEDVLLIAPHRQGRTKPAFNDGRWMSRYRKRWKIERLFAWLHNFRRLVVRYEYHPENYHAFLQLACALILIRYL
jgi:transposase